MQWPVIRQVGFSCWSDTWGDTEIRFLGKGPDLGLAATVGRLAPVSHRPSWLRQAHGCRAVRARGGCVAEADALVAGSDQAERSLALVVVTADCVPVLWAGAGGIAAIHAGWRGIESQVIAAAINLQGTPPASAWIGPAIGVCCYQVAEDVATRVAARSVPEVVVRSLDGGRPHLDLVAAVSAQLQRAGVASIRSVGVCTRCHGERLWSYRREGPRAGRNLSLIWRR